LDISCSLYLLFKVLTPPEILAIKYRMAFREEFWQFFTKGKPRVSPEPIWPEGHSRRETRRVALHCSEERVAAGRQFLQGLTDDPELNRFLGACYSATERAANEAEGIFPPEIDLPVPRNKAERYMLNIWLQILEKYRRLRLQ
jgi:hypothetical protein